MILLLIVGQLKFAAHIVINGLFWFFFPAGAIIVNDIMAYVCGISFGRKFIKAPFLKLSPNKTWEGFIGKRRQTLCMRVYRYSLPYLSVYVCVVIATTIDNRCLYLYDGLRLVLLSFPGRFQMVHLPLAY